MHHYLKQKLMSAKHVTDLIPFVNILIGTDELKKQLLSALDTQYQKYHQTKTNPNQNFDHYSLAYFLSTEYHQI